MPLGFNGKWLRVDLSTGEIRVEIVPEDIYIESISVAGV